MGCRCALDRGVRALRQKEKCALNGVRSVMLQGLTTTMAGIIGGQSVHEVGFSYTED